MTSDLGTYGVNICFRGTVEIIKILIRVFPLIHLIYKLTFWAKDIHLNKCTKPNFVA